MADGSDRAVGASAAPGNGPLPDPIGSVSEHINVALPECGTIFLLPCKVASSSIRRAIRAGLGRPLPPDRLDYVDRSAVASYSVRIAFVRHPLDRLASCWADKFVMRARRGKPFPADFAALGLRADMDFAAFVRRVADIPDALTAGDGRHFRSLHADLTDGRGALLPTFVGRFENLAGDWRRACALVMNAGGPPLPRLEHLRRSGSAAVAWSAELVELAGRRYAKDRELFGYADCRDFPVA